MANNNSGNPCRQNLFGVFNNSEFLNTELLAVPGRSTLFCSCAWGGAAPHCGIPPPLSVLRAPGTAAAPGSGRHTETDLCSRERQACRVGIYYRTPPSTGSPASPDLRGHLCLVHSNPGLSPGVEMHAEPNLKQKLTKMLIMENL